MNTPDSALLRALFDEVVELEPSLRAQHLDAHCPPGLRATLDAMLEADIDPHEPPSRIRIGELAGELAGVSGTRPAAGSRIGPFEIVDLLGEGGFSTVLHARREVAGATQDVALKLLRRSLRGPEARHQFRREQQALLRLHHPNIARMIEGGVTDDGQPYIALERVDGSDIIEHARARGLSLRARLQLFVVACRAVDAAHRALIVHRDLKPSNVFVSADGEVKLLDFGIAKLLEGDEGNHHTLVPTFTPAYAAPEQRSGGAITTATDVYALGVLLGELLTGERVNDGSGRTPSSRVGALAVDAGAPTPITRRQLRGDLDTIVMKAIAEDPEQRYASAGMFADDVERLLDGRPVRAHLPSAWYRTRKFVARHKGSVAGTLVLVLGILTALGLAIWQAGVARQQAALAAAETRRAETVRDFLVSVFEAAQPEVPRERRPGIEELVDGAADRASVDQRLVPEARLDLLLTLAGVLRSLGDAERTHALLDRAAAQADALRIAADAEPRRRLRVLRAQALLDASKPAEARAILADDEGTPVRVDALGIDALVARAIAEGATGDLDAARRSFAEARTLAGQLGAGSRDAVRGVDIAEADALVLAQRFPAALELAEATRAHWEADGAPTDRRMLSLIATISTAASATGALDKADAAYREAIALAERIHARPHPDTAWVIGVYGSFLVSKARYAEAEPYVERALAMRRNLLGDTHPDTLNAIAALGRLRAGQSRRAEAREAFEEGVERCREGEVRHAVCPRLLGSLSQMLLGEGELEKAGDLAARAVENQRVLSGDDSPQLVAPLQFRAQVEVRRGRHEEALRTTDELLAIATRAGTLESKDARYARFRRALALFALGRNDEALELARAVSAEQKAKTPDEKSTLFSMLMLEARALARAGRHGDAAPVAREALAIEPKPVGTDAAMLADLQRIAGSVRGN